MVNPDLPQFYPKREQNLSNSKNLRDDLEEDLSLEIKVRPLSERWEEPAGLNFNSDNKPQKNINQEYLLTDFELAVKL